MLYSNRIGSILGVRKIHAARNIVCIPALGMKRIIYSETGERKPDVVRIRI